MPKRPAVPAKNRQIIQYALDSAQTFKEGAAVLLNTTDEEVDECGADPALILGFAEHAAKDFDGGVRMVEGTKVLVALARPGCTFWMSGTTAPVQDDLGKAFGIVKDADSIWVVDKTEVAATRVRVVAIDIDLEIFEVSVLAANQQVA